MQVRKAVLGTVLTLSTIGAAVGVAQVRPGRHPNLAAAQRLCAQAAAKVSAAQAANEYDMGGHAAKAKELLDQASNELNQAAGAANRN